MSSACCGRRPSDGTVDREVIDRAVRGQAVDLAPEEFSIVTMRLKAERTWGLSQIARHTGYSRSRVAAELARQRNAAAASPAAAPRRRGTR